MIKKPLMQFSDGRGDVSTFHLINNILIVIRETIKNDINLVLVINSFAQNRQLIKACGNTLEININGFGFLLPAF